MASRLLTVLLLVFAAPPAFAGSIFMDATPYPDSVVIDITIDDTGGADGCPWLGVVRLPYQFAGGGEVVGFIPRQIGTTRTVHFVDTTVERNTLYCYEMKPYLLPIPVVLLPCGDICQMIFCFTYHGTCVNTGPDPAFLGHGLLSAFLPDGTPVDGNEVKAMLYPCDQPPTSNNGLALQIIPADAEQYLDTGEGVDVYGTWCRCLAQGMYTLHATVVNEHSCVLAVESSTWGRIKAMYRD